MKTYNSIVDIKRDNKRIDHHFFDASSMDFFNSCILRGVYKGVYFITSEQFDENSERLFTVRVCLDGKIETVGKFQAFENELAAITFIKSLPAELPQALAASNRLFNTGKMDEFVQHAVLEQNNNTGKYSLDSFCGACAWMFENYELIDSYPCKAYYNEFKAALKN